MGSNPMYQPTNPTTGHGLGWWLKREKDLLLMGEGLAMDNARLTEELRTYCEGDRCDRDRFFEEVKELREDNKAVRQALGRSLLIDEYRSIIAALNAEVKELKEEREGYPEDIALLRKENESLRAEKYQIEDDLWRMDAYHEDVSREVDGLLKEVEKWKGCLEIQQDGHHASQEKVAKLMGQVQELGEEFDAAATASAHWKEKYGDQAWSLEAAETASVYWKEKYEGRWECHNDTDEVLKLREIIREKDDTIKELLRTVYDIWPAPTISGYSHD